MVTACQNKYTLYISVFINRSFYTVLINLLYNSLKGTNPLNPFLPHPHLLPLILPLAVLMCAVFKGPHVVYTSIQDRWLLFYLLRKNQVQNDTFVLYLGRVGPTCKGLTVRKYNWQSVSKSSGQFIWFTRRAIDATNLLKQEDLSLYFFKIQQKFQEQVFNIINCHLVTSYSNKWHAFSSWFKSRR